MTEKVVPLSFPLDNGFLRRECPLCKKGFKVLLKEEELTTFEENILGSFLTEPDSEELSIEIDDEEDVNYYCPYCGQEAYSDSWWTQEQLAYAGIVAHNIMAEIVNEQLVRPLEREFRSLKSGFISLEFKGEEIKKKEPWISPESDDMMIFDLPCCQRQVKIDDSCTEKVICFFCGFAYGE